MKALNDHIKPILALIVVAMTYTIFIIILFRYSTDNNAVSQVIIAVVSGFSVATGYYFGYSQGASKKDETINQMNQPPITTTDGDININTKN